LKQNPSEAGATIARMVTRRSFGLTAYASAVALLLAVGVLSAQDSGNTPCTADSGIIRNDPVPATTTVNGVAEPVYTTRDGATKPRQIQGQTAEYTKQARRDKVQGAVVLLVVVTKEGDVADVKVKCGPGHGLDENAVKAVRKWRFEPATKDGKPVAVQVSLEVDFHLR
jgi:TonB family protein